MRWAGGQRQRAAGCWLRAPPHSAGGEAAPRPRRRPCQATADLALMQSSRHLPHPAQVARAHAGPGHSGVAGSGNCNADTDPGSCSPAVPAPPCSGAHCRACGANGEDLEDCSSCATRSHMCRCGRRQPRLRRGLKRRRYVQGRPKYAGVSSAGGAGAKRASQDLSHRSAASVQLTCHGSSVLADPAAAWGAALPHMAGWLAAPPVPAWRRGATSAAALTHSSQDSRVPRVVALPCQAPHGARSSHQVSGCTYGLLLSRPHHIAGSQEQVAALLGNCDGGLEASAVPPAPYDCRPPVRPCAPSPPSLACTAPLLAAHPCPPPKPAPTPTTQASSAPGARAGGGPGPGQPKPRSGGACGRTWRRVRRGLRAYRLLSAQL